MSSISSRQTVKWVCIVFDNLQELYDEYILNIIFILGGMLDNSTFYDLDLDMDGVISTNEFDEDLF